MQKRGSFKIFLIMALILIMPEGYAISEEKGEESKLIPQIEYKAGDLRDPFQSLIKKEPEVVEKPAVQEGVIAVALPSLNIQGIVWGSRLPQAIINDKVVKVSDTIEGAQIININKEGITVSFGGREYNLSSPAKDYSGSPKEPGGSGK